ncbi:substrate-binding domain-containing protein [Leifsonia sp. NPDC058248]|uniref:substrate-binding domain-containing protein n=1 Tax=Leifsonia sp. NPDC058248 TaxID=3346402 RepID=UPI0036D78929
MTDPSASIGLVIRHGRDDDPVADAVVRAIASPLLAAGMRFVTRSVTDEEAELGTYRLWARAGGIAGVVLLGVGEQDARIRLLRQIEMPFVALAPASIEVDYPAVTVDATAASTALTAFLDTHHSSRCVYVTGQQHPEPFGGDAVAGDRAIEVVQTDDVVGESVRIGVSASEDAPLTLVLDSDHDADLILGALEERGVRVPEAVALICWSDSLVCQSASRPITAIDRRGREIGTELGLAAIAAIHGEPFGSVAAPAPVVVIRETT